MRPGEGVSGTLTIGNDGDVAGDFAVRPSGVPTRRPERRPAVRAGRARAVRRHRRQTPGDGLRRSSRPTSTRSTSASSHAGEERDYLFSATLPDGGDDDNVYQGSGLSLGFEWRASATAARDADAHADPDADRDATPTPTPTPTPDHRTTPTPCRSTTPTRSDCPPPSSCVKGGKLKFKLKAPRRRQGASPRPSRSTARPSAAEGQEGPQAGHAEEAQEDHQGHGRP